MPDRIKQSRSRLRGGFTLIELLVVMTIIVLMVSAAVPAIRFIVGSRSTESATNIVSAALGRARSGAIQAHRSEGVFFFLDPDTDVTTMAIVAGGGKDELAEYEAWTDLVIDPADPKLQMNLEYGQFHQPGRPNNVGVRAHTTVTYYPQGAQGPSKVQKLVAYDPVLNEFGPFSTRGQLFLQPYSCKLQHNSNNNNRPREPIKNPPQFVFWGKSADRFIDLADNTDFQTLPPGVGLQLINDTRKLGSANYADRYVRTGCILFDANGQFQSVPWGVASTSTLGAKLRLPAGPGHFAGASNNSSDKFALDVVDASTQTPLLYSEFGVVLYDRQVLKNIHTFNGNGGASLTFTNGATENDAIFAGMLPGLNDPNPIGDEKIEEDWLDNNTLPLMVNRQNGTLIKGE